MKGVIINDGTNLNDKFKTQKEYVNLQLINSEFYKKSEVLKKLLI